MTTHPRLKFLPLLLIIFAFALPARAEVTAFGCVKEGDRDVGSTNKDQIIEIQGEHVPNSRFPTKWEILYLDPQGTFSKTTRVIFTSGKKTDVQHPQRVIEGFGSGNKTMDLRKLNVDSDQAIDICESDSELKEAKVKITSSQMSLTSSDTGPVWEIRLWAARPGRSSAEYAVGTMKISAEDGTILQRQVKVEVPKDRDRDRDRKKQSKEKDAQ